MRKSSAPPSLGLRHVALWIDPDRFDATVRFYRDGMGMQVQWQPDDDNVYLTSGADNLALHRLETPVESSGPGKLDHIGFCVPTAADVGRWHDRIASQSQEWTVEIVAPVKTHRDGATSFYLRDPSGTQVQVLHIPDLR